MTTDKEKSQRFLQVVNLQDEPYAGLCMVFTYDWQQALYNKYQEKVNSEQKKVFQLINQLENGQKEFESESSPLSQYRLFIGDLNTIGELQEQQEFLKNLILRKLSGENLDWQKVLPQKRHLDTANSEKPDSNQGASLLPKGYIVSGTRLYNLKSGRM